MTREIYKDQMEVVDNEGVPLNLWARSIGSICLAFFTNRPKSPDSAVSSVNAPNIYSDIAMGNSGSGLLSPSTYFDMSGIPPLAVCNTKFQVVGATLP